jgi:hypothetical protein
LSTAEAGFHRLYLNRDIRTSVIPVARVERFLALTATIGRPYDDAPPLDGKVQVWRIAEDSSDRGLQACALAELANHGDGDWIRSLATPAADERTRRMARSALGEQPHE